MRLNRWFDELLHHRWTTAAWSSFGEPSTPAISSLTCMTAC